jgi:hypothetical protein
MRKRSKRVIRERESPGCCAELYHKSVSYTDIIIMSIGTIQSIKYS